MASIHGDDASRAAEQHHPLTDPQAQILAIVGFTAATLSVAGSGFIMVSILRRKLLGSVYHRIMFSMSALDLVVSTVNALQVFLLPQSVDMPWVWGNEWTCSITGFFYAFSFGVAVYNAALASYFWLTAVHGWREDQFRKYEIPMHVYAVVVPFVVAVVGWVKDLYHPLPLSRGCYIASTPRGCSTQDEVECLGGENPALYTWTLGAIVVLPPFLVAQMLTLMLYWSFRQQEKKRQLYQFEGSRNERADRKMQSITAQCMLYFFFLFNAVMWCTVLRIMESFFGIGPLQEGSVWVYPFVVLAQATYPSQGLGNWIVYLRPRYLENFRGGNNITRFQAVLKVLGSSFDPNVQSSSSEGKSDSRFSIMLSRSQRISSRLGMFTRSSTRSSLGLEIDCVEEGENGTPATPMRQREEPCTVPSS